MDTDAKRDEIRRQKNKPWYVKCPWFERELRVAYDEIDRLRETVRLLNEQNKRWEVLYNEIEQHTKEEVWESIQTAHKAKGYLRTDGLLLRMDEIEQAIDSVGEK